MSTSKLQRLPPQTRRVRLVEIIDRPEPRAIDRSRNPRRLRTARVLLSPTLPYRILFGADLVADREWEGFDHIDVVIVDEVFSEDVLERAQAGDLDGRIDLACALFAAGLKQHGIGEVLRIDKAEVTRLRQIAKSSVVRDALRAGFITLGHARVLARQPYDQQANGLRALKAKLVSVRALESNAPEPKVDPNLVQFTEKIQRAVGSPTALLPRRGGWTLRFTWCQLAELQSIMETLGRGNATGLPNMPNAPRSLTIQCESEAELEALVEHLMPNE